MQRKYTAIQVPKTSKAHAQLRRIAKQLGQQMQADTGMSGQSVTIYQALEFCVAQGQAKLDEKKG